MRGCCLGVLWSVASSWTRPGLRLGGADRLASAPCSPGRGPGRPCFEFRSESGIGADWSADGIRVVSGSAISESFIGANAENCANLTLTGALVGTRVADERVPNAQSSPLCRLRSRARCRARRLPQPEPHPDRRLHRPREPHVRQSGRPERRRFVSGSPKLSTLREASTLIRPPRARTGPPGLRRRGGG